MYSIGEIAKITDLTSRALRHYEQKGLIKSSRRGSNGYRYFSKETLLKIKEIKKYKAMDFSLDEIKSFLEFGENNLESALEFKLQGKLKSLSNEISRLEKSKNEVQAQLMATKQFFNGKVLAKGQRRVLMEAIKSEVLENLKLKRKISSKDLEYLKREDYLFDTPEKRKFIEGVKTCLQFAKEKGIRLGPARGAAPALLSMYALGWSKIDPMEQNLVPERFSITNFDLHIDVEFERGKEFIDFCRRVSADLPIGKIEAFKLPILDIIESVHKRIGGAIDYDSFSNDDPIILDQFRKGDIEYIISFDIPATTLVAKHYDEFIREGKLLPAFKKYLSSQEIIDFEDLLNIEAVFRPDNLATKPFMQEFINRYPKAKKEGFFYPEFSSSINEYLKPNFGMVIYQEDIIYILREYTSWSYEKCNEFRRKLSLNTISESEMDELREFIDEKALATIVKESPVVFCKAHSRGAWPRLIKATAILKALHKDIYLEEIHKWEAENGYSWGDFGFISGGVSLLQQ